MGIAAMDSSDNTPPPKTEEELKQLLLTLHKVPWFSSQTLYLYQGFWIQKPEPVIAFQNHFQARDTDIFITSTRKSGTTWLKALLFSICNRSNHLPHESPLITHNPHELVPQLESNIYAKTRCPDYLENLKNPRLFGTHLPFSSLPSSIKDSKCKIIYICRNPFDTFVSSWFFYTQVTHNLNSDMEKYFDMFCEGKVPFGPFEDHVLLYWKQSQDRPKKVLFVKYEDLKADSVNQVKRIAEFTGFPFSEEESRGGLIDEIIELCSFQKLQETEASKRSSTVYNGVENKWFFRKGEVGDWVNYMTPDMVERLEKIMEKKFRGSGLLFNIQVR